MIFFRGPSLLGNPDFTGTFLVVPAVLSAALGLSARGSRERYIAWACFGVSVLGIAISLTRGAWIGVVVGMLVLVVAAARSGDTRRAAGVICCSSRGHRAARDRGARAGGFRRALQRSRIIDDCRRRTAGDMGRGAGCRRRPPRFRYGTGPLRTGVVPGPLGHDDETQRCPDGHRRPAQPASSPARHAGSPGRASRYRPLGRLARLHSAKRARTRARPRPPGSTLVGGARYSGYWLHSSSPRTSSRSPCCLRCRRRCW